MKILVLLLSLFYFLSLNAQEVKQDTFDIKKAFKSVTPYGTIENVLSVSKNGLYISDFIPRVGLKGEWFIDKKHKYNMFMKIEFGLNLVSRNEYVHFSPDPGQPVGKVQQSVYLRLGLIGISTPFGNISIGRQWGVNYTLSGNIDDMYLGGGYAIGVYSANTDGGVSGTGRADQLFKYELKRKKFYLGLQSQFRNITVNDQFYGDSYGIASYYDFSFVKIGASYNKVLDGVEDPIEIESKINDELATVLIDFKRENWHFGIMPEYFVNHEKDDIGEFYSGWGIEYSLRYHFGKEKKWRIIQNSFILRTQDSKSEYLFNGYTVNLAYRFSENTAVILGFTFDNSTNKDGSRPENHILGLGFYYNFNYPVP